MRKIKVRLEERVETGAIQFNQDWPGLFIRGDDCMYLSMILRDLIAGKGLDPMLKATLADYVDIIDKEVRVKAPARTLKDSL